MHRYRVTLESLSHETEGEKIEFEVENHDDIFDIIRKMSSREDLDDASKKAFAVGLKLFSEVVLKNRDKAPFSQIRGPLGEFIKSLKSQARKGHAC